MQNDTSCRPGNESGLLEHVIDGIPSSLAVLNETVVIFNDVPRLLPGLQCCRGHGAVIKMGDKASCSPNSTGDTCHFEAVIDGQLECVCKLAPM